MRDCMHGIVTEKEEGRKCRLLARKHACLSRKVQRICVQKKGAGDNGEGGSQGREKKRKTERKKECAQA